MNELSRILFAAKHVLTVQCMSRPLFEGSYLQVMLWALGQWKGRKICHDQMIILIVSCNIAAFEHGFGGSVSAIINFHIWPCEVFPFLLWILIIVNETLTPTVLFQEISIPLPWWIFGLTSHPPSLWKVQFWLILPFENLAFETSPVPQVFPIVFLGMGMNIFWNPHIDS